MSKLGIHLSGSKRTGFGEMLGQCYEAGSPVPCVMAVDQNVWDDIVRYSEPTVLVFRHQPNGLDCPNDIYTVPAAESARRWMAMLLPVWRKNRADYYALINEQAPGISLYSWLNDFHIACMQIAQINGFRVALYAFAGGNPADATEGDPSSALDKWGQLLPSLKMAKDNGHVLLLHEYGLQYGTLNASAPYTALRYRGTYEYLRSQGANPNLIISEAGAGVGGLSGLSHAEYMADVAWYDEELMKDPEVIGCCLYQLGGDEQLVEIVPELTEHIKTHPTPILPDPVTPRKYDRVVHLIPQNFPLNARMALAQLVDINKESVVYSADDAFIRAPQLASLKVYVWDVEQIAGTPIALEKWVATYYAPVPTIVYRSSVELTAPDSN